MRVIGIDPGYDRLGIAVLEGDPSRPTAGVLPGGQPRGASTRTLIVVRPPASASQASARRAVRPVPTNARRVDAPCPLARGRDHASPPFELVAR